jgi:hypothetical protein
MKNLGCSFFESLFYAKITSSTWKALVADVSMKFKPFFLANCNPSSIDTYRLKINQNITVLPNQPYSRST